MAIPTTSRRKFLQTSTAAGASLLLTGTRASGQVEGANDRVRIAIAGLNSRGNAHMDGWL
ncbi:MAG: twin-arginine translocation signal domain-containing protein, partial [Lacipirellulaceae bacterium]